MFLIFSLIILLVQQTNIDIMDPWLRPGAKGMNTAMYFEIVNKTNEADTLYMAKSSLANIVELHETYKQGDMMGMRKTKFVVISPKSSFKFQPGGNHIMMIDLKKRLIKGMSGEVSLYFKKAGKIKVKAVVRK
ncbi:MAG: copper chaperone PCu(A)C [Ignavibacteriales bacterium]|nr:copper chaperone PCu(A)C [Ignavibacteriales bacterium]